MRHTMKVGLLLPLLAVVGCASGGASINRPAPGCLYSDMTGSIGTGPGTKTEKKGKACATNLMGLIASGDASVAAARSNGSITRVATVDYDYFNILSVYTKSCTIVRGD